MNAILAVFTRELRAYFLSPLAYLILFFFLIVHGYFFAILIGYLNDPRVPPGPPLDYFFGDTFVFWLVLIFVGSVLTMRLLAEERKSGSIEVLMTAPVTEGQVVAGKYLAALAFYVFLWLPTLAYALVIDSHVDVDWGPVAGGYLGVFGIGALFLAIGTFASALSKNQIIAAVVSFAVIFIIFTFGLLEGLANEPWLQELLAYLNLWSHMDELKKGIVDTRRLVYYLSGTVFFLFLTSRTLDANKWR